MPVAALPLDLGHDGAADGDEAVHARRERRGDQVRSSALRTRLEWTVPTMYGRGRPSSPRRQAARVPTISARYMWLWMTCVRLGEQVLHEAAHRLASSGVVDDRHGDAGGRSGGGPWARRSGSRPRRRSAAIDAGSTSGADVLLGSAVGARRQHLGDPDALVGRTGAGRRGSSKQGSPGQERSWLAAPRHRQPVEGSSTRAPLVLVGFAAAQEVEAPAAAAPARSAGRPRRRSRPARGPGPPGPCPRCRSSRCPVVEAERRRRSAARLPGTGPAGAGARHRRRAQVRRGGR